MTCWQAMKHLEDLGYTFRIDTGRVVGVLAGEAPTEAAALLEIARADRAAAAEYVRQREAGAVVVDDGCTYSMLDALAIGQAVKRGDAVLLTPVVYHSEPMTVTVLWQPVHGVADAVLAWHRERLETALCRRLKQMEEQTFDGWTDAEIDHFCEKYAYCKWLMEGCR